MVKQEMARVSIDILGISELKWTGMGEFHLDDPYIYLCGKKPLEEIEYWFSLLQVPRRDAPH